MVGFYDHGDKPLDSQKQINMTELLKEVFVQMPGRQFHPLLFSILLYISGYIHMHVHIPEYIHAHECLHVRARTHARTHLIVLHKICKLCEVN